MVLFFISNTVKQNRALGKCKRQHQEKARILDCLLQFLS